MAYGMYETNAPPTSDTKGTSYADWGTSVDMKIRPSGVLCWNSI